MVKEIAHIHCPRYLGSGGQPHTARTISIFCRIVFVKSVEVPFPVTETRVPPNSGIYSRPF